MRTRGSLVDCAPGVQTCENGAWSSCRIDASRDWFTVPAPGVATNASTGSLGLQAIGGDSASCTDNVCNPYCQYYEDVPDEPVDAPRVDSPTGWLYGGTLASSNVPTAFKGKGSLDEQCRATSGSALWNEACQFDQHCVSGKCVAFQPDESGACEGIDVTAPTTCVDATGGTRAITVCNRGTEAAPAGIKCYTYSGGSPQFPNSNPGLGSLVYTTTEGIEPGQCVTTQVAEATWGQNGIQSVACNPPESVLLDVAVGPSYPSSNATVSGSLPWASAGNAGAPDSNDASATPANPAGASTGALSPTADGAFGTDGTWNSPSNAYSALPAGSYATVAPAAPTLSSGSSGATFPGTWTTPATSSDTSFNNPQRAAASDGSYATATPPNPETTFVGTATSNDGGAGWTDLDNAYISGARNATATLSSDGKADGMLTGYGLVVPDGAVLDSLTLTAKWKTDFVSSKYKLSAQALTGSGNTAIGSELFKSDAYTTETTDSLTIPAATLSGFTADQFSDAKFKVRLRFDRANGHVQTSTASVDYVQVTLKYHMPTTTASVVYQNFGFTGIPSNAQVQLTTSVKWKTSAVNANFTLGMQVYTRYGGADQAAQGSEVTRTAADTTDHIDTSVSTLTGGQVTDSTLAVRIRAIRKYAASNPDVTASVDYVQMALTWTTAGTTVTHSIYLKNFGLDQLVPSNATITSVTTAAQWKLSAVNTHVTFGLQAYKSGGTVALGSESTNATGPTSDTVTQQVLTSGITASDLSDANFGVRVRVSRDGSSTGNPDVTASLDYVTVTVAWTAPSATHTVAYGNFGLSGIPAGATITRLTTEVGWRSSVSTGNAVLGFQPYVGTSALGSETIDGTAPVTARTLTQTLTGSSLTGVTGASLANGTFTVRVRATRGNGSSNNPNFSALVDFVRVTATYQRTQQVSIDECNSANNWTATKLVPSPDACQDMGIAQYVPFTFTRVFQGTCADGGPVWRHFEYNTATPAGTQFEFRFRAFLPEADGTCLVREAITSGEPLPVVTASLTQDPPTCAFGSGENCPVDLHAALGDTDSRLSCLQMDAVGTPTPGVTPELLDWNVLYDCTPDQ